MKISFHGACKEVTGSCILIESNETKFLVDCGMFQGKNSLFKNIESFSFDPKKIDFVLLTHAHLDHCGRLPKLFEGGFRGRIYSTAPTRDLTEIILLDALKVSRREKRPFIASSFKESDISSLVEFFTCLNYGEERKISENIRIRLRDAGHILGSAIFEVWIKDNDKQKKIVFSGDLGNPPAPIVKDPEFIDDADIVFMESTYGNRFHESKEKGKEILKDKIKDTINKKGVLMIPVFAMERTQELLYELNNLIENKIIPEIPVFLDSPLAIKATSIYRKYSNFYDEKSLNLLKAGDDIFDFSGLEMIKNDAQARKVDIAKPPKIILAGSGMFQGGKIGPYLKKYISNPDNNLLIISYQTENSLGRKLINGEKDIDINGKRIKVRAGVSTIFSFSSHSDQIRLVNWIEKFKKKPKKIFIIHGEEEARKSLSLAINVTTKIETIMPYYDNFYEI